MEKIVIMAYMGTGKTELERNYKNVLDFDFQDYKYIYDETIRHLPLEQRKGNTKLRTENTDYPQNFINAALEKLNNGIILVSPFIEHVYNAYSSKIFLNNVDNVRIIIVAPERDNLDEYVRRFKKRGNSEEFIARRIKEYDSLMDLFDNDERFEKIVIKHGQYLDYVPA